MDRPKKDAGIQVFMYLYEKGLSDAKIANIMGVSRYNIFSRRKEMNLKPNNKSGKRDKGKRIKKDIVLWRDDHGEAYANIPHLLVKHSPTGFEWGYHGSGPADLALNILFYCTDDEFLAKRYYQYFKQEVISGIDKSGGIIPYAFVVDWLRKKILSEV